MSSGGLSQLGASAQSEDWLRHRLNFIPLPHAATNLLPRISTRISFDSSRTTSLTPPEQVYCPPAQTPMQQAEGCVPPKDSVGTPTEVRQPRCFSLPGSYNNLSEVHPRTKIGYGLWLTRNRPRCIERTVEEPGVVPNFAAGSSCKLLRSRSPPSGIC